MTACKKVLAGVVLLLSAAVLLLSLAGVIGVWLVKGPATDRATHVFEQIEAALDRADDALILVNRSLAHAADSLNDTRKKQRELSQKPEPNSAARKALARTVQKSIAPDIGNASEKLHAVAEAAVVVNSILGDLGNLPFLSASGLDTARVKDVHEELAKVGPAAWELSRLLGEPGQDADADAQFLQIEGFLKRTRGLLDGYELRLKDVRERTRELKARTLFWTTPGSILISATCFWIALSQVILLAHAWSWWKASGLRLNSP
jgi:hypothetical protein